MFTQHIGRIVKISRNKVAVLGLLKQGVYETSTSKILITSSDCSLPEEAFQADFDVANFVTCLSFGIVLSGEPKIGDIVRQANEKCGDVGCGVEPIDSDILFGSRHVAIIGGTGSGKTSLIMRAVEKFKGNGKIVILAYHPDLLELSVLPHVEVVQPKINICDLDYQSLFMLLQFHRLSAEPVKMQRYLRMLLPIACKASKKFGEQSHEVLLDLLHILTMLEDIEQSCKSTALVADGKDIRICRLRQLLEEELGRLKYGAVKHLARSRDAESINSLLMYSEMALTSNLFGETKLLGDKPVTVVDITSALSLIVGQIEGRLASILSLIFTQRIRENRTEPLYVVVDEFVALSSVEYIRQIFELLLMQGRKFGIYLIVAGQPHPSIYDLLSNLPSTTLGRVAGSHSIKELATSLPNVPTEVLRVLPTLQPMEMIGVSADRILPFRVLHPSWRNV